MPSIDRARAIDVPTRPTAEVAISTTNNAGVVWIVVAFIAFFGGLLLTQPVAMLVGLVCLVGCVVARSRARRDAIRLLRSDEQARAKHNLRYRRSVLGLIVLAQMIF
jgi:hypothetical protein